MKISLSRGLAACAFWLLLMIIVLPASGVVPLSPSSTIAVSPAKPMVSAIVSSATPTIGDPVTVSGTASGGNLTAGVQIWVFAGNYVNVSTVPVTVDGTYTKTYATTGLPTATYYVFVQTPGNDGAFNLDLAMTGRYSGQVVNSQSGALLLNFTGTGSVQNAAASTALTNVLNQAGIDDVYTKTTFRLGEPATATTAEPVKTTIPLPAPTAKSPLSPVTILIGVGIAVIASCSLSRRS
jgi:hypothetical protein